MRVVIRTDASIQIGTGHVMRCLTLADALRARGAQVTFVCREHPGHLCTLIESDGYRVVRLSAPRDTSPSATLGLLPDFSGLGVSREEDARETLVIMEKEGGCDWLIVDHYALDATWETAMRPFAKRIIVIDDLSDRAHASDILLDQNLHERMEGRYRSQVPSSCVLLLGPRFALLRNEFREAAARLRERDGHVRHLLVFFGGADAHNMSAVALRGIERLECAELYVDVVVGVANPHREAIQSYCAERAQLHYYCQVSNMAELMARADLAVGAGGSSTWERCALGLPSVVVSLADNQVAIAKTAERAGVLSYLGSGETVSEAAFTEALDRLMTSPETLCGMSGAARKLVDTRGCERVWQTMEACP